MRRFYSWFSLFLIFASLPALACTALMPAATTVPATPIAQSDATPTTSIETATAAPATAVVTTVPQTEAVINLQDVRNATIQIEAQGSFVDPQVGLQLNVAGRGSGFIIDPSGIAVTNNHVVTGAALLRVYIAGETRPRNARVLGVSECSDLAVIQIEGNDFPYLEWFEGPINVGQDVYAAGFPLGDPEYTLTRGVVSKARASGTTSWSSVDRVLEHDATINPGNSGGPLVDPNGRLIGVNYATASSFNQYFAIGRDEAVPIIEQLRRSQDVNSIGINGVAVTDGQNLSGIWVSSVKSGSPADRAGITGGDIIVSMEGLVLATDGSMNDYCSILRSHAPEDTLSIEVLRFATEEFLVGQLNGRVLEASFSFARELETQVDSSSNGSGSNAPQSYPAYARVIDDSGAIVMDAPTAWGDIDGSPWTIDGVVYGAAIRVAGDLNRYSSTWSEPGAVFRASQRLVDSFDEESVLDVFDFSESCNYDGRYPYSDPVYSGVYDLWTGCGSSGAIFLMLSATPADRSYLILLEVQIISDADLEALDKIWNSFLVVGELPGASAAAPTPTAAGPAPTATAAGSITASLRQAMLNVKTDLERAGGQIDQAVGSGTINCTDVVNTYDRIVRAPTFNTSGSSATVRNAYDSYRAAVGIFSNGAKDMAQNCRDFLANPAGGSIPFQQWGNARQSVNNALDRLNPAIQSLR
jgi:serine protease Do